MRLFFDKQDVTLQDYGLPIHWFPVEAGTVIPLFSFSLYEVSAAVCLVPPVRQVPDAGIKKRERDVLPSKTAPLLEASSQKYSCGKEAEECACDRGGCLGEGR